jgi:hypothetical protein
MTHDELLEKIDKAWKQYESGTGDSIGSWIYFAFEALRAVVELHKPEEDESFLVCSMCIDGDYTDGTHDYSLYPCETIQAIEKELN